MAVLTMPYSVLAANLALQELVENEATTKYIFIGRPIPWINDSGNYDDAFVPSANISIEQTENSIYRDLVFGKRILSTDVSLMIPRYDWTSGTEYTRYWNNDANLFSKMFYVVTDDLNVYKCIDNNYNGLSTVKPSVTSAEGTFSTADGYMWKYMYTIPSNLNNKFSTRTFIPVLSNSVVVANAIPGSLDVIDLVSRGNNYSAYYSGFLMNSVNNNVVIIDQDASPYSNFYVGSSMYLKAGFGAGQIRHITQYDGLNKQICLDQPFDTYMTISLSDISGHFNDGDTLTQNIDSISIYYNIGTFQVNDTVVQTDTGVTAQIIAANSINLSVVRSSPSTFTSALPIYNTLQSGTLKSGNVSVQPFSVLSLSSNTGAFTLGEKIYQSNGSANIATGIVHSTMTNQLTLSRANGVFVTTYQVKGNVSSSNAVVQGVTSNNVGLTYIYSTNTEQTSLTSDYSVGSYIRVGSVVANNIRRVSTVNTSCIVVDIAMSGIVLANVHYNMPSVTKFSSYVELSANGYIFNTNLTSVKADFTNISVYGQLFTLGERVNMVDVDDIFQGTYGVVSFCSSTSIIISDIVGSGFVPGMYIRGESSLLKATLQNIINYPNITISSPIGTLICGQQCYSRTTGVGTINGQANVVSWFTVPGRLTEYLISPTVNIEGDGTGALAYCTVNTEPTSTLQMANVIVLNVGSGYTWANISITSNLSYGSGASAMAGISPLMGHGSDVFNELGAHYVEVAVNMANSTLEDYYFPTVGKYRKVGLLDTPLFDSLFVHLNVFDRTTLTVNSVSGGSGFIEGETVLQANTLAAGIVVAVDDSNVEIKNVLSTFIDDIDNDNIIGCFSHTEANVKVAHINHFNIFTGDERLYNANTFGEANLVSVLTSNTLQLSNIKGRFNAGDMVYDPVTNAYANISTIHIANDMVDATESFGRRFNQTLRLPLTISTSEFHLFEQVEQSISGASGQIIGGSVSIPNGITETVGNDVDMTYVISTGAFAAGQLVFNDANTANGIVMFANDTYLRLSSVSGTFSNGENINNILSSVAAIGQVFPVLILNNVNGRFSSGILSGNIVGSDTGAVARCNNYDVIKFPDLVRNTGKVMYFENLTPFNLSNSSQSTISFILKF